MTQYFTPEGRLVPQASIVFDEAGLPFTYEWFDGADDLWEAYGKELEEERAEDREVGLGSMDINFKKVDESEAANLAMARPDEDDEQINRLKPVKGVWRGMVHREFEFIHSEWINCECRTFTPKVGKKGQPLKSGTWSVNPLCPFCAGKGKFKQIDPMPRKEQRWARLKPFKASKDQLIRYMQWKSHKVPEHPKTHKATTAAKEIDRIAKTYNDSLYVNVLVRRAVDKVDGTYCMGFTPWDDGRVHSEFAYGPASGQLNSRRPNVQNLPKHIRYERLKPLDLPKRFRRLIRARPGHRIWEFDYKSFHILTLGFNAQDATYMRMARLDMHSYFSSHMLVARGILKEPISQALSDSDLKAALKDLKFSHYLKLSGIWQRATEAHMNAYGIRNAKGEITQWNVPSGDSLIVKELRDQNAKPGILGKGLAMSAYRLYMENRESFTRKADAEFVMDTYDKTFPKEIEYQKRISLKAHNEKLLVSKHGFIRRFWDVFHFLYYPDGHYDTRHGEDYEASIAFHVQNDAFGHIREAMNVLDVEGLYEQLSPIALPPPSGVIVSGITAPSWFAKAPPALANIARTFTCWNEAAQLINTVHDSLVFEIPIAIEDRAAPAIKQIMERRSSILVDPVVAPEGLWCEVECSNGANWADLEEVKI